MQSVFLDDLKCGVKKKGKMMNIILAGKSAAYCSVIYISCDITKSRDSSSGMSRCTCTQYRLSALLSSWWMLYVDLGSFSILYDCGDPINV